MNHDDETLLLRAADGDIEAFGLFFDRHAERILRYFQLRTAAGDVARDLCAETFAAALISLHRYDPSQGPARAWITGIARNKLYNWFRSERMDREARHRLRLHTPLVHVDDLDLSDLRIDLRSRVGELDAALATLSEPVRDAVLLRVVHELPYADIAERLTCSPGAARVRVSRGLSDLLDHFEQEVSGDE